MSNILIKDGRGKAKTPYISQKMYPTWKGIEDMNTLVDKISNTTIKNIVTTCLSSGFRIGEICNSYAYWGDPAHSHIIIRAVAEKKRVYTLDSEGHKIKIKTGESTFKYEKESMLADAPDIRGFFGEAWLKPKMREDVWKSVRIYNQFNLTIKYILDNLSTSIYDPDPIWLFPKSEYNNLFKLLKKAIPEHEVFFFPNARLEEPVTIKACPSFHHFRKAAAAKFIQTHDLASTVNWMRWDNINTALWYIRLYQMKTFDANSKIPGLEGDLV